MAAAILQESNSARNMASTHTYIPLLYMAGDRISCLSGWQEGAVRSAWWTLGLIRDRVIAQTGAQ